MPASGDRKTIFITGAGSGIGQATAKLFAQRGWFVGLGDVDPGGLLRTQALLPAGRASSHAFDVRDREGWRSAIGQFGDQTGGRMHVLFNSAGAAACGAFEDVPEEAAERLVDVNLKGVINGCYAALPLLKATRRARIVTVSCAAGLHGAPNLAVYSATKFAVRGLTQALDLELARHGVRATSLDPWFTETPLLDQPARPGGNRSVRALLHDADILVYSAESVAKRAWDAARGPGLHFAAGGGAQRLAWLARYMPGLVRRRMAAGLQAAFN